MGFKCLVSFNQALISKQLWRLLKNPDILMSKVLKSKYYPSCSLWEAQHKTADSWLWSTWLKSRNFLRKGVLQNVGDGCNTSIWSDPWLAGTPNLSPSSGFISDRLKLNKVSDLMCADGSTWDQDLIEQSFSPEEASLILNTPLSRKGQKDLLYWHPHKKGIFTVKFAYSLILASKKTLPILPESSSTKSIEAKGATELADVFRRF
ncbi:Ribonuclease H-like superfamily protein [Striga hermonthica]|uniref:Ribonuclease H-like superfamily protein n=1 Tax=Striga hermonthica TaxID=68872 RepID=A0A9N7MIV2_STRHE|nr:Ribonuclease H-like superfamily protein [Striga hermonthica]